MARGVLEELESSYKLKHLVPAPERAHDVLAQTELVESAVSKEGHLPASRRRKDEKKGAGAGRGFSLTNSSSMFIMFAVDF